MLKSAIKNLILVFVSIILTLFLTEAILNIVNYQYTPLKIIAIKNTKNKYDWRKHHIFEDQDKSFVYDPYLIWRPKKNKSVFNKEGYRGKELSIYRGSDTYCIFTFGDSNTLGIRGKNGSNWPGKLDKIIRQSNRDCLVINAGVWGYTLFQGLQRFKEALHLKPNMALICFGSNDAHNVVTPDKKYIADRFGIKSTVYRYKTGLLLISLFDRMSRQKNAVLEPRVSLGEYENYLMEIIALSRKHKIELIFLTRPLMVSNGNQETVLWFENYVYKYNDALRVVAHNNNVKLIDLYQYFEHDKKYFQDICHFTDEGDMIAARLIYKEIKDYLPEPEK